MTTSTSLYDNHGRPLHYLRLAVTDRCNLRCFYCMPEEGIHYLPRHALLSFEEIVRLVTLVTEMGISKVRLTGGEPFVRNDLMTLMKRLRRIPGLQELHLTTNGVLTAAHIPELKKLGIASVNLSLDTLDRARFLHITRRDAFPEVRRTLDLLLEADIPVKVNAVVMQHRNIEDLIPLAELTRDHPLAVRFIEEMPFNGTGSTGTLVWTHRRILDHLRAQYPQLEKAEDPPHATARHYQVPGYRGRLGIIAAFTRTFCGSCNRIRVTAQGMLKTCLYDDGALDVRQLLRCGVSDEEVKHALMRAFSTRARDGFEAEARRQPQRPVRESMSTIGG